MKFLRTSFLHYTTGRLLLSFVIVITLVKPFKVLRYLQSGGKIVDKVLEKLRNEKNFNLFWDNVTAKAKSFEVDKPKLPRKRGAPKKLEDFFGFGPAKPSHPDEPKDPSIK